MLLVASALSLVQYEVLNNPSHKSIRANPDKVMRIVNDPATKVSALTISGQTHIVFTRPAELNLDETVLSWHEFFSIPAEQLLQYHKERQRHATGRETSRKTQ